MTSKQVTSIFNLMVPIMSTSARKLEKGWIRIRSRPCTSVADTRGKVDSKYWRIMTIKVPKSIGVGTFRADVRFLIFSA